MTLDILILAIQGIVMMAFLVIGAAVTVRTRSILRGGLATYGGMVLWGILFCLVLPSAVYRITRDLSLVHGVFPDARGAPGIILICWIHGIMFAAIVRGIQIGIVKLKKSWRGSTEQEDGPIPSETAVPEGSSS